MSTGGIRKRKRERNTKIQSETVWQTRAEEERDAAARNARSPYGLCGVIHVRYERERPRWRGGARQEVLIRRSKVRVLAIITSNLFVHSARARERTSGAQPAAAAEITRNGSPARLLPARPVYLWCLVP